MDRYISEEIMYVARKLHCVRYDDINGRDDLFHGLKEKNIVVAFPSSDDLIELRGAVYDEVGASGGHVTRAGMIFSECEAGEDCPYFQRERAGRGKNIKLAEEPDGTFSIVFTAPCARFDIIEDNEIYGTGIVFDAKYLPE